MAKKKNIKPQDVSAEDIAYIDYKMNPTSPKWKEYIPNEIVNYDYAIKIKCKTAAQKDFLNMLKDDTKQIVVGMGSAGSGKSWISLSYALQAIKDGKFKKLICIVPSVQAGSKYLNVGLLPGQLQEKMDPFIQSDKESFVKILEKSGNYGAQKTIDGLMRQGVLDYRPLSFIRGASWDDCLIFSSEVENFSIPELLLLITRIGENSKLCLTGDPLQCDRPDIRKNGIGHSGIEELVRKLEDMDEFGCVEFGKDDVVRNKLITKILERFSTETYSQYTN